MTFEYQRVPEFAGGRRLHLNENTRGCSPAVLAAIRGLDATRLAFYPAYASAIRRCADHLGVDRDAIVLTNGLDEGIMAACLVAARDRRIEPESIVIEPAFDMYAACTDAAGGTVVTVAPEADFVFPTAAVLAAITPVTRLVFLTNPNNPTGRIIESETIAHIAHAAPQATIFLDEAYGDFARTSFLPVRHAHPNVLIGRTFAKAHGLAALRVGVVIGAPDRLEALRRAITPYSLNVCAAVALEAALDDPGHVAAYVAEVEQSRRLLYAACDRWRVDYWESAANFVLIRLGDRTAEVVSALARRGIFVRDRSNEPGCAGCVRITAGVVDDTRACIQAMEEILCDAR